MCAHRGGDLCLCQLLPVGGAQCLEGVGRCVPSQEGVKEALMCESDQILINVSVVEGSVPPLLPAVT